jgi:undecaprenyl-diphosphatase
MSWLEALILGIVQGLTEFLPVSSSGHLAIGATLFGLSGEENLTFTIAVHAATVLSTIVVLGKEVAWILKGAFKLKLNEETNYLLKILVSMIPVGIVGVFFKDFVEDIFGSGLLIVGLMLLVTSALLSFAYFARPRQKDKLSYLDAFVIGISQAFAVMPGLSRSGTTIATGLLLGNKKETIAKFSFLMVLLPILGEATLKLMSGGFSIESSGIAPLPLLIGFISAFVAGSLACKLMINIVKKGKLIYFAVYCALVGLVTIVLH